MAKKKAVSLPPGPRAKKTGDRPPARLTTHKKRAAWFQARAAYPVREADVAQMVEQRSFAATLPRQAVNWIPVGPTNVGGRCTSLAVHPGNPDIVYIGSAGGGVWRSNDAGRTWTSQWHDQPVLNIGALAIDPRSPDTVYCGTGEANGSGDSYAGVGVFRTQDGGATWVPLASTASGLPLRIGVIAIDPFDSAHLILGGVSHDGGDPSALFTSADSGATWQRRDVVSANNYWCHSVVFHPGAQGLVFATVNENGAKNGIWQSSDGGVTWLQLTNGLPDTSLFSRTSLAIAPSQPDTIYALASDNNDWVLGVFRSTDRGASWTNVAGNYFKGDGQMNYGNSIVVHPTNPDYVLCGGVDLHLTTDGGQTWTQASKWNATRGTTAYAHADHHALVMPASKPGRIYDANDGGMDLSEDGGKTWTNRSSGLAATMFYDIDVAQSDGANFGGGAQDNGSVITTNGDAGQFSQVLGGDGGWLVFDPADAAHFYCSYYNFNIFRYKGGNWADVTPSTIKQDEQNSVWMTYITLDPSNANTVYAGTYRVWKTSDDGATWTPISASFDGTAITAIEVPPANPRFLYVGTEKGGFYRSQDGGATWSGDLSSATLPGSIVTRIETHPAQADLVWVTVGGVGARHVFQSSDGGSTWTDIDKGQLPDSPHHAIVCRPDAPNTLFVACDTGVFRSDDAGANWANITGNMPNTMFVDVVYQRNDRTLTVATYGRSMFRLAV